MVGWHHLLNGRETGQILGDGDGQGSLVCSNPWGHKESDTTEQLNNDNVIEYSVLEFPSLLFCSGNPYL